MKWQASCMGLRPSLEKGGQRGLHGWAGLAQDVPGPQGSWNVAKHSVSLGWALMGPFLPLTER